MRRPYDPKLKRYRMAVYGLFVSFMVFVVVCLLTSVVTHLGSL